MLLEHRGARPVVPESAYVAPSAVLCGAVTLGERARVLHGAVLTAENGEVRVGADVVVMENALVRGRAAHPAVIGDAVLIGPHAHVNGATIEDEVFVATGAALCSSGRAGGWVGAALRAAGAERSVAMSPKRRVSGPRASACSSCRRAGDR